MRSIVVCFYYIQNSYHGDTPAHTDTRAAPWWASRRGGQNIPEPGEMAKDVSPGWYYSICLTAAGQNTVQYYSPLHPYFFLLAPNTTPSTQSHAIFPRSFPSFHELLYARIFFFGQCIYFHSIFALLSLSHSLSNVSLSSAVLLPFRYFV